MEKAYDLKDLGEKLKAAGLPIAEDALEKAGAQVYGAFKAWIKESAPISETKIDDVAAPFIDQLDAAVLPLIAKLDLDGDGK